MIKKVTVNKAFSRFIRILISQENPKEAQNCQNFGFDSKAHKGKRGIMVSTDSSKTDAIVGYIHESENTEIGESRMYATDEKGADIGDVMLNKKGEFVILGGNDYAVAFNKLKTQFNELQQSHNLLVTNYNLLVTAFGAHTHLYAPGPLPPVASGVPNASGTPSTPSIANIDLTKVNKVRL